jgi:hypothetical protein
MVKISTNSQLVHYITASLDTLNFFISQFLFTTIPVIIFSWVSITGATILFQK